MSYIKIRTKYYKTDIYVEKHTSEKNDNIF